MLVKKFNNVLNALRTLFIIGTFYGFFDNVIGCKFHSFKIKDLFFLTNNSIYLTVLTAFISYFLEFLLFLKGISEEEVEKDCCNELFNKFYKLVDNIYRDLLGITHALNSVVAIVYWNVHFITPNLRMNLSSNGTPIIRSTLQNLSDHLFPFLYTTTTSIKQRKFGREPYHRIYIYILCSYYSLMILYHRYVHKKYPYQILDVFGDRAAFISGIMSAILLDLIHKIYFELFKFFKSQ
ncbi:hypothetical protein A0H76_2442 [Hepatospora eriocheir]|uniref:Uncharacterized protein n=1 Tax=Hepatospora eriocheir TaxID=1081669 RepID=A0A1X0QK19_9MICR|nr:hypothetical protein A0H76_2442 [Hepatospora eriocheir]